MSSQKKFWRYKKMKVNVNRIYEEAVGFMSDGYEYPMETVVSSYLVYKKIVRKETKQKDFVIDKFLKHFNKHFDDKYVRMVYAYFFDFKSREEVVKEFDLASIERVSGAISRGIGKLKAAQETEEWFILSTRENYLKKLEGQVIKERNRTASMKSVDEWEKVEDMGFTERTSAVLKRNGVETLKDLTSLSDEDLIRLKGMGQKSLNEITAKIERFRADVV